MHDLVRFEKFDERELTLMLTIISMSHDEYESAEECLLKNNLQYEILRRLEINKGS